MVVGWEVKLKKLRVYPNLFIYYYALYHNIDHLPSIETPLKIWAYYLRSIWRFFYQKKQPFVLFSINGSAVSSVAENMKRQILCIISPEKCLLTGDLEGSLNGQNYVHPGWYQLRCNSMPQVLISADS